MGGRAAGARVVGSAFAQYLDQLSQGDPWAIGFTIFGLLLLAGVAAVFIVDRRSQAREAKKSAARTGANRPAAGKKPSRYDR